MSNAATKKRGGSAGAAKDRRKAEQTGATAPPLASPLPRVVVPPAPHAGKAQGVSANWQVLKRAIGAGGGGSERQQKQAAEALRDGHERRPRPQNGDRSLTRILGLDCEMVGVGPDGSKSALARVVVVNAHGNSVLDTYVKPQQEVTDYRTAVSGVRPHHLQNAPGLGDVQTRVAALLRDRLVVGHALHNDLKALLLSHPRRLLRDTAKYPPLMRRAPHVGGPTPEARRGRAAKLQELAAEHLGLAIQMGEHSPVEDARAAVLLYHKFARDWERWLRKGGGHKKRSNIRAAAGEHGHGAAAAAEAPEGEHAGGTSQQRWKRKREELHAVSARKEAKKRHGDGVNKKTGGGGGGWSALLQRASSRGVE